MFINFFSRLSQDTPTPANVAEYDIKAFLPEFQTAIPLRLTLSVLTDSAVEPEISFTAIQEWKTISTR